MRTFLADLRYGFRMLFKHPGLAGISVTALALGIGLTTMMWSITYGGVLRGLPFEEADRLIHMERTRPNRGIESFGVPIHDFSVWRQGQHSFEDLSAWYEGTVNLSGAEGRPERFEGAFVTPSVFQLVRVKPILGRTFTNEEDVRGGPPVVVIGWDIWQNQFGGDSSVIGKTVRANGTTSEIVGVMPRGFLFPTNARIWLPLRQDPASVQPWGSGTFLEVMGRLKPGVSMEQAKAELTTISATIGVDHKEENEGVTPLLQPFTEEYVGKEPTIMLWTMMAAVFGVLLIACSNVANLLLARAAMRTKEVAIRTALGASRWRVLSQLLTEALVLSLTGAVIGIGIAWAGIRMFNNAIADTDVPFWIHIGLDTPVLLFVLGVTLVAALVSGVVPALQATRTNIQTVLKDESRGASSMRMGRFSRALVVVELALSGGLLVGAGFMIQSVVQLSRFDYGVPIEKTFTTRIGLFQTTYPDSASAMRFWTELETRLTAMPGHQGVALMTVLPGLEGWWQRFAFDGKTYEEDRDMPNTRQTAVTPGFFPMFGIRATEGRLLTSGDIGGSQLVAVVSRGFSQKYMEGRSPVGTRIRIGGKDSQQPWLTIVGVVPDVWYDGTDDAPLRAVIFTPVMQADYRFLSVAVAAPGDPMAFAEPVRAAVLGIDADQPIYFTRTLAESIRQNSWFYGVFGNLFAVFGIAALFLATVGVYGVMSFAVTRRTQEIGVRMALGASGRDVLRLFLKQGGWQIALGLTLGLGLAWGVTQGIAFVMFQVNTNNPFMYGGVTAALALTGFIAILIPALRATKVDPLQAIRYD